jgi:proteasome lid subunit RPN8/RPN11
VEEPKLSFPTDLLAKMRTFAEAAYPYEGCGVLLGKTASDQALVTEVIQGHNLVIDRRHDRYELDPKDIIASERKARERGEDVIGFYHTHPDHPARPSQFDTDRAWPGYHYVVVAVEQGRQASATAWRLIQSQPASQFLETELQSFDRDGGGYNPPGLVAEES